MHNTVSRSVGSLPTTHAAQHLPDLGAIRQRERPYRDFAHSLERRRAASPIIVASFDYSPRRVPQKSSPGPCGFSFSQLSKVWGACEYPRKVVFNGRQTYSYRFVHCVLERVAASRDQVVRHRCQNRLCLNPAHLDLGSQADNKRDDWEFAAGGVDFDPL